MNWSWALLLLSVKLSKTCKFLCHGLTKVKVNYVGNPCFVTVFPKNVISLWMNSKINTKYLVVRINCSVMLCSLVNLTYLPAIICPTAKNIICLWTKLRQFVKLIKKFKIFTNYFFFKYMFSNLYLKCFKIALTLKNNMSMEFSWR